MQGNANDVAREEDKNLKRQGEVGEGETTTMTRLQNGLGKKWYTSQNSALEGRNKRRSKILKGASEAFKLAR